MEYRKQHINNLIFSLLILFCFYGIYKIWAVIPDYSVQQTSESPNCPEPVRDICRVNQSDAFHLYRIFLNNPETLNEIDLMIFSDISSLLESYGITEDQDKEFILAAASASGCGHSILAEIIIDLYQDKPDLFKEKYGYPLYYEQDGEIIYNTETLFTDIFARTNKDKLKDIHYDYHDMYYVMTMLGYSMYGTDIKFDDMSRYLSDVLGENSETAAFKRNVSYKKYKEYMDRKDFDYACIGVFNFLLSPYGSNPCKNNTTTEGSGHWMRITGVTEDGHYIVSSWGEEWEMIKGTPFVEDKKFLVFQPLSENDGGLVFLKVND